MTDNWLDNAASDLDKKDAEAEKQTDTTKWEPKEGESLAGTLTAGDLIYTKYGATYVLTVVDKDDKAWTVWAGPKMLFDAVQDEAPMIGKGILIKFGGLKDPKTAGGNRYKYFSMTCEQHDFEGWDVIVKGSRRKEEMKLNKAQSGSGLSPDKISGDDSFAPFSGASS